jgi:hypothetical protein
MAYKDPHVDKVIARELSLFISNDGQLYRQMLKPIILNLARRHINKTYNADMAVKAWENLVEEGIRSYSKQHGKIVANPATRNAAAKDLQQEWQGELNETVAHMAALKKAGKPWSGITRS